MSPERESDPRPFSYQENVLPLNYLGDLEIRVESLELSISSTTEFHCNKEINVSASYKKSLSAHEEAFC